MVDPRVEDVSPPPNTTVSEPIGPANVEFNCNTFETINGNVTQVTTRWFLRRPTNPGALIIITDVDDPEFTIGGTERPTLSPYPTFRNLLTLVEVNSALDEVLLSCGHSVQGYNELATWTLRVYCKSFSYMCICVC